MVAQKEKLKKIIFCLFTPRMFLKCQTVPEGGKRRRRADMIKKVWFLQVV